MEPVNLETRVELISQEFPKFRFMSKDKSLLMKMIHIFLQLITFGRSKFMDNFVTTIGHTVYTPSSWHSWKDDTKSDILAHECIHMRQRKKYGPVLFEALYIFIPIPLFYAYYRAKFEMEAYEVSIKLNAARNGLEAVKSPEYKKYMVSHFTGSNYGYMMMNKNRVESWFNSVISSIE